MGTGELIGIMAQEKNISLRQLAINAGIPYNTLYAIVRRKSNRIEPSTTARIAAALEVPVSALVGSSDELQAEVLKNLQETKEHLEDFEQEDSLLGQVKAFGGATNKLISAYEAAKKKNAVDAQERENRKQKLVSVYDKLNGSCQEKVLGYAEGLAEDEDNLVKYIKLPSPFQEPPENKK